MICVSVVAETTAQALADLRDAAAVADLIELRLDFIRDLDLRALLAQRLRPVIATCRPRWEGGRFDGPEEKRLAILREAASLGADYIDVEARAASVPDRGRARLVLSHHDFERTPDDVYAVHKAIAARKPDVVKVVTTAKGVEDAIPVLKLAATSPVPTVAFCMGEYGLPSRILYRRFGSPWTYAALRAGAEAAPGQLPAAVVRGLYHADRVGPETRVYAVLGHPLGHSKSPLLFNHAFGRVGHNAVYIPLALPALDALLAVAHFFDLRGLSVTIPHKEEIRKLLNATDRLASRVGAVNTVRIDEGHWSGHNTDLAGALEAIRLRAGPELKGKRAAVLGAGGAARAVAVGLLDAGADVTVANRTSARAEALARELGCQAAALDAVGALAPDILVNATSVGMHPKTDESPVPASAFRPGMVAFDLVYNPPETRFLADARRAGAVPVGGVEMFVRQAAAQWRIWFGEELPPDILDEWRRLAV